MRTVKENRKREWRKTERILRADDDDPEATRCQQSSCPNG